MLKLQHASHSVASLVIIIPPSLFPIRTRASIIPLPRQLPETQIQEPNSNLYMSYTLSENPDLPYTFSKKRSPEAAFPPSADNGLPLPDSRPPSRAHKQKRQRFRNLEERPRYVSRKEESIVLGTTEGLYVDVLWPGMEVMERGLLSQFLEGRSSRNGERETPFGGIWETEFTVLCFLGATIEHLQQLSQVARLLEGFHARTFGVSLSPPPPNTCSLPIIHDFTRSLTLHLGLMHPLGGGRQSLDAIVVLDKDSRRRMLLPIGLGNHAPQRGKIIGGCGIGGSDAQLEAGNCVKGVEWLAGEREAEEERLGIEEAPIGLGGEGDVEMGG